MSTEREFSIPVRDLDAAGKAFRFPVRAQWLRGALEGTDINAAGPDGSLDVRLSKSGTDVVVHGTVEAELSVPCARCLEPAHVPVREPISVLVVPESSLRESAGDEEGDDVAPDQADLIAYDGETVVLDDLVRDELVLAIPMIPLCSEACPGIRPLPDEHTAQTQGSSEQPNHIDPRLRPLLRLKKTQT